MSWQKVIASLLNKSVPDSFALLERTQLDTLNIRDLLNYCQHFAFLCELLHVERPLKISRKALFEVGDHESDSYWIHLVYWCGKLGRLMIEEITDRLTLTTKLNPPSLSNAQFANVVLTDLIVMAHEVVGLLYYCDIRALSTSLFVAELIPDSVETIHETHRLLCILNAFAQSRLQLNYKDWSKAAKALALTQTLLNTLELKKFKIIEALSKDLLVQTWVIRGQLYLCDDNKVVEAGDCFEESQKLGYVLNASAQEVIDERDLIAIEEANLQSLVQNKELPTVQTDILLRGRSPLENFRELKDF